MKISQSNRETITRSIVWITLAFAFLFMALCPGQTQAAITQVQTASVDTGITSTGTVNFAATGANNLLVVAIAGGDSAALNGITSVVANPGNIALTKAREQVSSQIGIVSIWYLPGASNPGGLTSITYTVTPSPFFDTASGMVFAEYSGVATTSPLDGLGADATNNVLPILSGNATSAAANELWFAAYHDATGTTAFGSYTGPAGATVAEVGQLALSGGEIMGATDSLVNSAGTAYINVGTAVADWWVGAIVIFKATGGGATQTLDTWTDNSANSTVPVTNLPMATIASTAGSGGVSLTATQVTVGGTVAAADVASVSVLWGATQVGIVNNPASLTNINISLSGAGLSSNNLVYQISLNASAAGKTYSLTVNSVTGSTGGALTLPQTTATMTASSGTCTRNAPTVALSPTSANVTQGGNTTYNVTLTNNDTAACTGSSTFTLSAGDSNTTDFNASTLSATIPNPCTIGPAATCTATLTATAKATGTVGNTDTTTVTATDTTNHNGQNGTGTATTTITATGGGAQVPAGNVVLWLVLVAAIGGYGIVTTRRRRNGDGRQ